MKDILDKQTRGPALWDHPRQHHLPRYQWTACEARTRLRFLAYSHCLNRTNGLAFLILVLLWLRAHGITILVTFQTDWGREFGGDNPRGIAALEARFLQPLGGQLKRYPPGRKGYMAGRRGAIARMMKNSIGPIGYLGKTKMIPWPWPPDGSISTMCTDPISGRGWTNSPRSQFCAVWGIMALKESPSFHLSFWTRSAPISSSPATQGVVTIC